MECPLELLKSKRASGTSAVPPVKGIVYTPEVLADAVIRSMGVETGGTWLDPSAGSGQLVRAALRFGVPAESIVAIDLQTRIEALERLNVETRLGVDFLEWAGSCRRRFDRVIANPPFVRLGQLADVLIRRALATHLNGVKVTAAGNYWVAFLMAGMRLLKPGGSLAYILPAAWEYADYAQDVRTLCRQSFRTLDVHRVSVPMFEGIADGSIVVVGQGFGRPPYREPRVFRHASLAALTEALHADHLVGTNSGRMREEEARRLPQGQVRFRQIAEIGIGAVTGDAGFFLLNENRRRMLGLPRSSLRPVLSKARHIVGSEVDDEAWTRLLTAGNRVWLFYPSEADLSSPAVQAYLELPQAEGGCRRRAAKIRLRDPWYRVRIPDYFDGFMTGMSQSAPWVLLNRMPDLTVSNTLYGVRFRKIRTIDEQAAWCLSMLSSKTVESRANLAREYPQGLLKLEPSDVGSLVVRRPGTVAGARDLYREATDLIARGRPRAAQALVDNWLG